MKKEKGFTLIELLAVIVILAILMVIAVPKILNVIENSKKSAAESSIKLVKDAIKTQVASESMMGTNFTSDTSGCYTFNFDDQTIGNAKELQLKNKENIKGTIKYCNGKFYDDTLVFNNTNTVKKETNKHLKFRIDSGESSIIESKIITLNDMSGNNNNAQMTNVVLSKNKDYIEFNGTSYGTVQMNQLISSDSEVTLELILSTTSKSNSVIYIDPYSKIAFGIYGNSFIITTSINSKKFNIPSDFFNGEKKHIILLYDKTKTDNELYINNKKISPETSNDNWTASDKNIYIGRRNTDYFVGKIYGLRVYNKKMTNDELGLLFNSERVPNSAKDNLKIDYKVTNDNNYTIEKYVTKLKDVVSKNEFKGYNAILSSENGIVFNGSSTYFTIDGIKKYETETLEMVFKPENANNGTLYDDPISGMGFGIYNNRFVVTTNYYSKVYSVPKTYSDGRIKHVIIVYDKTRTNNKLFINNTELESLSDTDCWSESSNNVYIGRKTVGNYFNGTLYEFNIYDTSLSSEEIKSNFEEYKLRYNIS